MKKRLSFAVSIASAALLSASTINWELPNLTDGDGTSLEWGDNAANIVFILASDAGTPAEGVFQVADGYVVSGSNVVKDQDDEYIAGTWTDSNTSGGNYVMAFYDGESYYAISDGAGGYLQVTAPAENSGDPLVPGSSVASYHPFSDDVTSVSTVAQTVGGGSTPSVPEPATAALAVVGVAMLLRRRAA